MTGESGGLIADDNISRKEERKKKASQQASVFLTLPLDCG